MNKAAQSPTIKFLKISENQFQETVDALNDGFP